MLLVYVDTGGMLKEVAALEAAGLLKTHYFPFEQRNRRVKAFVPGSGATWKQSKLSWKEAPGTWNDYKPSALFEPLRKLLGAQESSDCLTAVILNIHRVILPLIKVLRASKLSNAPFV